MEMAPPAGSRTREPCLGFDVLWFGYPHPIHLTPSLHKLPLAAGSASDQKGLDENTLCSGSQHAPPPTLTPAPAHTLHPGTWLHRLGCCWSRS